MIQTLADALAAQGYDTLTPVQTAVTDPALEGQDLLVSAQTGSGKTVGFGLAIAPTLLGDATHFDRAGAPLALIIAPTRELAMQVSRELTWLYGKAGAVVTTCVGGMDQRNERRALDRGAHIVVATPGRLCDHIKRENIDLGALRAVVLDEADEMLDLGFKDELEFILSEAPEDRRTLLFSATVSRPIERMAQSYQRDAQRITTIGEAKQHSDIEYRALTVHPRDTENAILNVLRFYEAKNAIVFCNTRAAVARLTTRLTNRNFSVVALSGELTQSERTNALQALRDGRARVCVATDVAARGIDLPNLELVIHFDLPKNHEILLHRSGRTGRAGRKGVSALIVPAKMKGKANRLIGGAKLSVEWAAPPSADEVRAADEARLLSDPAWSEPVSEEATPFVEQLTERFDARQLAAAFVNLYRTRVSAPEELTDANAADDRPRAPFGPSVWFSIAQGRNDGAEPRTLLPMLCRMGDLTKDDIGAIRVRDDHSFVEVAEGRADVVAALGQTDQGAVITKLDKPPEFKPGGPRPGKPRGPKPGGGRSTGHRGKSGYDPDRGSSAAKPKRVWSDDTPPAQQRPKPATPKGEHPPKSPKTDRSPRKPGAAPKPRTAEKAKPVWKAQEAEGTRGPKHRTDEKPRKPRKSWEPTGDGPRKPKGNRKPATKGGKPTGKPNPKAGPRSDDRPKGKTRAADPSKRFTPPNKIGKPGARKGGDATPRRRK